MPKSVPEISSAPKALGPYSFATEASGLVFLSGQVALDPTSAERAADEVFQETHRVMQNIGGMLGDLGLGYADIVKTTIFMTDMGNYGKINEAYGSYFEGAPPARSAIEVSALPGGFQVEIEVVASR